MKGTSKYYFVAQWYKGDTQGLASFQRDFGRNVKMTMSTIVEAREALAKEQGYDMVIILNAIPLDNEPTGGKG